MDRLGHEVDRNRAVLSTSCPCLPLALYNFNIYTENLQKCNYTFGGVNFLLENLAWKINPY